MAFRSSLRPLTLAARSSLTATRAFHATRPAFVSVGDSIPNLDVLTEGSPANKVNLSKELAASKGLLIGVPGAFSMFPPYQLGIHSFGSRSHVPQLGDSD